MNDRDSLKNSQAYPVLTPEEIRHVQRYGVLLEVRKDELLVAQGAPLERFIVMLEGEMAVELTSRKGVELIVVHRQGEFSGDIYSLSVAPAWYPAEC